MSIRKDYKFTKEHEWAKLEEDNLVTVGITDFAQEKLGDIVSIELPKEGDEVHKDEAMGIIDSQKASAELYAPVGGIVVEINELLEDDPSLINSDPYEDGWMVRIEAEAADELDDLMSAVDYEEYLTELEESEGGKKDEEGERKEKKGKKSKTKA
jgi:glycine cleavage system H protein